MLNDADGHGGSDTGEAVRDAGALFSRLKSQVKADYNSKGQVNWDYGDSAGLHWHRNTTITPVEGTAACSTRTARTGIQNRYCSHPSRRPLRGLLRMRSSLLQHNDLMLWSERSERLEAWTARVSHISHSSC